MQSYNKTKEQFLKDKETHQAYLKLEAEFMLAQNIITKALDMQLSVSIL